MFLSVRRLFVCRLFYKPTSDADRTAQIVGNTRVEGLLLLTAGPMGNVIRILVPFTVTDNQLEGGLEILSHVVNSAAGGSGRKLRPRSG